MRAIITLALMASLVWGASAQKDTPFTKDQFPERKKELKDAVKNIEEGDSYYLNAYAPNYELALPFYKEAHGFNPNNAELNYKIGKCIYFSNDRLASLPYFEKAFKLRPMVQEDLTFYLGKCYHLQKKWDEAKGYYQKYLQAISGADAASRAKAQNLIRQCTNGKLLEAEKARVWIDNIGGTTNTKFPEYAPVISADESVMVYTARKPDSKGSTIPPGQQWHFEDLYMSTRNPETGEWSAGVNMGGPLNTKDHDATSSISPDGKQLFVYRSEKNNGGDLYVSKFKKGEWSKPEALGRYINTPHHEPGASISFDGKTLYFVSDKPGGLGDHDIYVSQWQEDKEQWGPAKNLGNVINTPFDDKSVFLHPDGRTLYFASEGHNSVGGLDIFVSYMDDNGEWGKPKNLGMPLNTPGNDMFLVVAGNGRYGYYASYQVDGYGDKDIYRITFLGPEKEPLLSSENELLASANITIEDDFEPAVQLGESNMTLLVGIVKDAKTKQLLEADVDVVNNDDNSVVGQFHADVSDGKFVVAVPSGGNFGIAVKSEGYLFHSENVNVPKATGYRQYQKEILMKKFEVGQTIVLKNIFFDYNKYTLRPESTNELERLIKLMNDYPKLKIELGGHTDTRGSDTYNQQLSENRARVVVEYLVDHGIAKDRLKYAGYGETKTIINDSEINSMKTTREKEDAHQENRRTEFKVLEI